MKIVFFGTSDIGVKILQDLIEQHQVLAVVTAPDKPVGRKQILTPSPIAELAAQNNIPILKPEKTRNNSELLTALSDFGADIFIVVSYGKILPEELLAIPPLQTINIHFSVLPKYRGPAPVQSALLDGQTTTGSTIFVLDKDVDHGPILASLETSIEPDDTNITLQKSLAELSSELLLETLPNYQSGQVTPQPQDHDQATFTKMISKENGLVDWTQTANQIYNRYRAFQPWPGIYTKWHDKTLKIIECLPATQPDLQLSPGQVSQLFVGAGGNSLLELITVQLEGKTATNIQDFLRGHPDFTNAQL